MADFIIKQPDVRRANRCPRLYVSMNIHFWACFGLHLGYFWLNLARFGAILV